MQGLEATIGEYLEGEPPSCNLTLRNQLVLGEPMDKCGGDDKFPGEEAPPTLPKPYDPPSPKKFKIRPPPKCNYKPRVIPRN